MAPSPRPPHASPSSWPRVLHHTCNHLAFCLVKALSSHPNTGVQVSEDTRLIYSVLHPTSGLDVAHRRWFICVLWTRPHWIGWGWDSGTRPCLSHAHPGRGPSWDQLYLQPGCASGAFSLSGFNEDTTQQILGPMLLHPALHPLPHSPETVR